MPRLRDRSRRPHRLRSAVAPPGPLPAPTGKFSRPRLVTTSPTRRPGPGWRWSGRCGSCLRWRGRGGRRRVGVVRRTAGLPSRPTATSSRCVLRRLVFKQGKGWGGVVLVFMHGGSEHIADIASAQNVCKIVFCVRTYCRNVFLLYFSC